MQFYCRTLELRTFHQQAQLNVTQGSSVCDVSACYQPECLFEGPAASQRPYLDSRGVLLLHLFMAARHRETQRHSSAFYTHIWWVCVHVETETISLWEPHTSLRGQISLDRGLSRREQLLRDMQRENLFVPYGAVSWVCTWELKVMSQCPQHVCLFRLPWWLSCDSLS